MEIKKIAIVGCGAFGYALALLLGRTHKNIIVNVFDVDEKVINELSKNKKHPFFHKGHIITNNILPTTKVEEAVDKADLIILAVPAQFMRGAVTNIKDLIPKKAILLHVSKALETSSDKRMSEVITESLNPNFQNDIAALAGGMLAHEVADEMPVGADIACESEWALTELKELFLPSTVHVEITPDLAGVEFSSSFKNVVAIGSGIIDGLKLGTSCKAFYIAQLVKEVEGIAVLLGANKETFHTSSNAWVGDLLTTCFGNSRNRLFGELLGQGKTIEEAKSILDKKHKHAEGLATVKIIKEIEQEHNLNLPFFNAMYSVMFENKDAKEVFMKISLYQNS